MKFSRKHAGFAAAAVVVASLFTLSAFADSRPRGETWRDSDRHERRDDRDRYGDRRRGDDRGRYEDRDRVATIAGMVERINHRRDFIVLREARSGRTIYVDMDRVESRRRRADLHDLRRGDFVRLTGEWDRDGFEAWRIDDIRFARRRR